MNSNSTIDYLFEDPPITGQTYALISIVGPHMPQKCDIWGLKVRGVVNTLDQAKTQTQKLMNMDNNYDIYTVEVGKFFPLAVEPTDVQDVEYQNTQLNSLIKGYLENRELANEQWQARKNEMIKEAIREGKEQSSNKKEHPIAVLQSVQSLKDKIKELNEELENSKTQLLNKMKVFNSYDSEERESSVKELNNAFGNLENGSTELSKLKNDLDNQYKFLIPSDFLDNLLEEIKDLEHRLSILSSDKSENKTEIEKLEEELEIKKKELNDNSNSETVNKFINSNYSNSPYNLM